MNKKKIVGFSICAIIFLGLGFVANGVLSKEYAVSTVCDSADYIVYQDGNDICAVNCDTGKIDFESTNATQVIQDVIDNTQGKLFIKTGIYQVSELRIDKFIIIEGMGYNTILSAETSINSIFIVQKENIRIWKAPLFKNLRLYGNDKATYGFYLDSSRCGSIENVMGENFKTAFIYTTSDQSGNSEFWNIENCDVKNTPSFGIFNAGSAGRPTDFYISENDILTLSGWGIKLEDCERMRIEHFFAGNSQSSFDGAILVTNPNTANGAPIESSRHIIRYVGIENVDGEYKAEVVRIDAPANTTTFNRFHKIEKLWGIPENKITLVHLMNTSSNLGRVRSIRIADMLQALNYENAIIIENNVALIEIEQHVERNFCVGGINDSGIRTIINGCGEESTGIGNPPTSHYWEIGNIVRNTSDNTLWIKDKSGVFRKIG